MDEMEEVVKRAQGGDVEAIEYILNQYRGYIWKCTNKYYIRGEDYQDIYQEGLIGVWIAINDYKRGLGCSFETFATLCIKRRVFKLMKNSNRKKHAILNNAVCLDSVKLLAEMPKNPEKVIINKEKVREIWSSLSDLERHVVLLRSVGFTFKEIAWEMKLKNEKQADNAISRARAKAVTR